MTEFRTPNGALVSDERADPIAGPFAQHRVPILAARNKKVGAVIQKRRKREVGDGPRVPGRHERHSFMRVRHFSLVIVKKNLGLEGHKMKKGGIVVEIMMAGALRADGQRRMIGDDERD